ncbi:extracellular solute-binding protein [Allokutzneria oryzae]|uniref:Extracellular solute-binding protein n=1 Tax=Allokutzneria oryzae TaxID=1378989 RepID=A0ABV6A0P8_9PSEU
MSLHRAVAALAISALLLSVTACGNGSDEHSLKVVYQRYGEDVRVEAHMKRTKEALEAAHPEIEVELIPVVAPDNEYLSKVQLMQRSPATAPDVIYEDSFNINADVDAGYLAPLDEYLAKWPDWHQIIPVARESARAIDGKTYGVPMATDTRGLWFNRQVFASAGLPENWQPRTWEDILTAARTIKERVPEVIPFAMPAGRANGEAVAMQSVEMLLYGTRTATLYDEAQKKWVVPSQGMAETLRFVNNVFATGLGPSPAQVADPRFGDRGIEELTKQGRVGIRLDGSWLPAHWSPGGKAEWPEWSRTMAPAAMPTQFGQAPGRVSLSGGWTLAVGARSKQKENAFRFITSALDREGALALAVGAGQLPVRRDIAKGDPRLVERNPTVAFWTGLIDITHYRPTLTIYPRVSQELQIAMDQVVNGADAADTATAWAAKVTRIVGLSNTRAG